MKYRKTARPLALLVASLLALQPVSALAVTFADINQVPWPGAETSINKAADLGLVVGETKNGKSYFRPKDTVSLSEACQFTYKVLLQTKKATANASTTEKWKTVMDTYKIQDWAYPAVSYCLENNIISISDLSGFVKNGMNMPASREQAAEMMGRALVVGAPSYSATATNTNFKDNASIASDARPYIALLNAQGIVNGDDLKNFNPKKTLNRTETAVMVTNLYSKLNSVVTTPAVVAPTTASGTVNDMNSHYVNLEGSNAYYLYSSSGVTATLNGSASSIDALVTLFKDGSVMKAALTLDGNTRITKITVTAEEPEKEKDSATEGTLTAVKYDEEDEDGSITLNKKTTYKIDDPDDVDIEIEGKEYDLEGLKKLYDKCKSNDEVIEVKLTLNSKDELTKIKGTIEKAEEDDSKAGKTKKGKVTDFTYNDKKEEGEIELDGDDSYYFDEKVKIYIDGEKADFDDLEELIEDAEDDDKTLKATLTLEKDDDEDLYQIEIFTEDYKGEKEELKNVSPSKVEYDRSEDDGSITIDGKKYKVSDVEDVEIEIKDGDEEIDTWEDMYNIYDDNKKMTLTLSMEDSDLVKIKGYVSYVTGRLTDFDDDTLTIEGKDSGAEASYTFTKPANIKVSISGKKFANLEEMVDWLTEEDDDGDLDLGHDHNFTLKFDVTDKGAIKGDITGKFEKE